MTEPAARGALRALILQHEEPTSPGHVTEWLGGHGAEMDVFRIDLDEPKADPEDYDLIVSLGSEFAAYDSSHRFVTTAAALMRRAVDANVPILGLCFVGQLLAHIEGEEVARSSVSELVGLPVQTRDPVLVPVGPSNQLPS